MTLQDSFDLYANRLTVRLMRRHRQWRVVNAFNDNRTPPADFQTADTARGREGRAPEGSNGAAGGSSCKVPVNARQARNFSEEPHVA